MTGLPVRSAVLFAVILGAVVVALLGASVWLGTTAQDGRTDDDAAQAALAAARQLAVDLITTDPERAEETFSRLSDAATGQFAQQLRSRSDTFAETLRTADVRSAGSVTEAGIEQVDARRATVLVSATSVVHNTAVPDGERRGYRMRLTLVNEGDRWLVSTLEFVP